MTLCRPEAKFEDYGVHLHDHGYGRALVGFWLWASAVHVYNDWCSIDGATSDSGEVYTTSLITHQDIKELRRLIPRDEICWCIASVSAAADRGIHGEMVRVLYGTVRPEAEAICCWPQPGTVVC